MISLSLLLSLLISLVFSAPLPEEGMIFQKKLDGDALADDNIKEFASRGEYGVAVNMPKDINQRNYLGMTRESATQMVNMFIKQSIQTSGGELFKGDH